MPTTTVRSSTVSLVSAGNKEKAKLVKCSGNNTLRKVSHTQTLIMNDQTVMVAFQNA